MGGVYYYSERGDRLIDLASFHDKLWQKFNSAYPQLSNIGSEGEINDIVEISSSRRLTMLEDRSKVLFQYCQNVVDPDVPTTVLQFLLLNEQDNEYIDLPKIDKEQAELARANFSTLRKEAQSIMDLAALNAGAST
ncbi:hypothetical protein K1719_015091 [Acacia pycnantha]|nr:hypothetical protein K1719_015091 [Acacia pycnantha]